MVDNAEAERLNEALIAGLKTRGDLDDPRIEAAFRAVPRHLFLPGAPLEAAYRDEAVPLKTDIDGSIISSISQPSMIAAMLHQLDLQPGQNVLEIGAGTGYSAALMQYLVSPNGAVTSVDIDKDMIKRADENLQRLSLGYKIRIVEADGAAGYSPRASYDRIIATASIWDVAPAWAEQLKPGGLLVAPIWLDALQFSAAFRRRPDGSLFSDDNIPCGFVRLRGPMSGPRLAKRLGTTPLVVIANDIDAIDAAALNTLMTDEAQEAYLGYPLTVSDFWHGLMPYIMLNRPADCEFGLYQLLGDVPAFGLSGAGFTLFAPGSACFVPYGGRGAAMGFGSADALIAAQEVANQWVAGGRGTAAQLRIALMPPPAQLAAPPEATTFTRPYHRISVWLEHGGAPA